MMLYAGSDIRVEVNIVGSQDTTGLMTSQELEAMAATVISPIVDAAYQSGCHTASVWDKKAQANIPRLMSFMNDFGLITGRDPDGEYHAMTDVIHKVLNDLTVDEWASSSAAIPTLACPKALRSEQTQGRLPSHWPPARLRCRFLNP